MYALYRVRTAELDSTFLETLKTLYPDQEIEISVCGASESEEDETAHLLRSPANRERLLAAIENVAAGRDLVPLDLDDLQ